MAANIILTLNEDALLDDMIRLEGEGFEKAEKDDFELYDAYAELMVLTHRDTGNVILVELDRFREKTKKAIWELRDTPLPWTFSLPQLGIKEQPLEDVLLAVWEKYKGLKMEWES